MLTTFLRTGSLDRYLEKREHIRDKFVCYLNKKWVKCVEEVKERKLKEDSLESHEVAFVYNPKVEKYRIFQGMPLLRTTKNKEFHI